MQHSAQVAAAQGAPLPTLRAHWRYFLTLYEAAANEPQTGECHFSSHLFPHWCETRQWDSCGEFDRETKLWLRNVTWVGQSPECSERASRGRPRRAARGANVHLAARAAICYLAAGVDTLLIQHETHVPSLVSRERAKPHWKVRLSSTFSQLPTMPVCFH